MTITIRQAKPYDVPDIVSLAVESVSIDPLPVTISRTAMREMVQQCISSPAHFCWVSERNGQVVGAMVALVQPGFWFERLQCSVLLYYSREVGGMVPLFRRFASWVKERPAIKMAGFELEPNADPRLVRVLKRLGFTRESTNVTFVRGKA